MVTATEDVADHWASRCGVVGQTIMQMDVHTVARSLIIALRRAVLGSQQGF